MTKKTERSISKLSPAQKRIFDRVLTGETTAETGERLDLSPFTVSNHIRAIFEVFGVTSKPRLLALFIERPIEKKAA